MAEHGGKWQLAFWVMTGLLVIGFSSIVSAVVTNDRIRQSEDKEIRCQIDKVKEDFNGKVDNIKDQTTQILIKLGKIETTISRR
jgi:hypothetical protein